MGKAQDPGPGSRVDNPQDVEVTGGLPMSLTTFVGREAELDELRSLFRAGKRLVTLVGIGGIGKTRLALQVGLSASDLGWAKVYLVELASLADPGLVGGAVLESVGGGSSRSPLQTAAEHLGEANALLILDCCEHVLGAARGVAEVLVRRCPSVTVLATSRSPLDIEGELVWPVPSLSVQKRGDALQVIHGPRRAQPGTYDAWVTAIQAVNPRFEFTDPPLRHSLAMTLALASTENRPAAVLTGPAIAARSQAWPIRRSPQANAYGMVQVSLQHRPLTASAALVWSGDLPGPLQQMLFDTADSLTEPARPQLANLISLTTA